MQLVIKIYKQARTRAHAQITLVSVCVCLCHHVTICLCSLRSSECASLRRPTHHVCICLWLYVYISLPASQQSVCDGAQAKTKLMKQCIYWHVCLYALLRCSMAASIYEMMRCGGGQQLVENFVLKRSLACTMYEWAIHVFLYIL